MWWGGAAWRGAAAGEPSVDGEWTSVSEERRRSPHVDGDCMKIGILGGTGKEGAGLGARWARAGHDVVIGSRDAERARTKAGELREQSGSSRISGESNRDAAALADVVVLALPAVGLDATLPALRDACRGKVVVSTVVPLTF